MPILFFQYFFYLFIFVFFLRITFGAPCHDLSHLKDAVHHSTYLCAINLKQLSNHELQFVIYSEAPEGFCGWGRQQNLFCPLLCGGGQNNSCPLPIRVVKRRFWPSIEGGGVKYNCCPRFYVSNINYHPQWGRRQTYFCLPSQH